MNAITDFLRHDWIQLVIPLAVLGVVLSAGWIAKRIVFRALERWTSRTRLRTDDILIESFRGPFMIWVLILGLHVSIRISALPQPVTAIMGKVFLILWIASLTIVAARLSGRLIHAYGARMNGALPVTSLTQNIVRLVVFAVGAMLLLNALGVTITPILTALGVGGLAVALALQDTLANFFAGFYISVANQVRVGDYIKLDSGDEGYVADIAWRSTTVRTLPNNLVIVPNAKLAQAIVTNYNLPDTRMSLLVPISVSYDSDPDTVERILLEEAARAAEEVPGLLAAPAAFVRFIPGFGDSSLDFTLICQVREFVDQYLAQHELRKRIFRRFREAGIEIPFPIRTVYLRRSAAGNGSAKLGRQADAVRRG